MKLILLPGLDASGLLYNDFAATLRSQATPENKLELAVHSYPGNIPQGYKELEEILWPRLPRDEPYLLLGESFSGPLSIMLAARKPQGLRALILCCSFAKAPYPLSGFLRPFVDLAPLKSVPAWMRKNATMGRFATRELRELVERALSGVSKECLRKRVKEILAVDVSDRLSRLDVPVLYLQAKEDRVIWSRSARQILAALPSVKLVRIEAPHMLLQCVPDLAARAIYNFNGE